MTLLHAKTALLPQGWVQDVCLTLRDGRIADVQQGPQSADHQSVDILLPAPTNLHSHTFQRAMAGLTERRGNGAEDSFWSWRQLMFRFLDQLGPEDIEAIAAQAQMEMLEAGYAACAEFHYLHHQPGGEPYDNPAELSARIAAAASETGIGLTLLPVLYSQGGVDGRALGPGQLRFGTRLDPYWTLWDGAKQALAALGQDAQIGVAPHSLRAAPPSDISEISNFDGPVHMHLAEQQAEVDEIKQAYGARPVTWVLDHLDPGPKWCLIHCTQMTEVETRGLVQTGAVAGLCPVTESSLGDGIFPALTWASSGGQWGVGTDSNILISLIDELKTLEYSQRLITQQRAVLAEHDRSTGRVLFEQACAGGAQAAGRDSGAIETGRWADLVALEGSTTDFVGRQGDALLDTWIFACSSPAVAHVWAAGRAVVRDGWHIKRDVISEAYRKTLMRLKDVM